MGHIAVCTTFDQTVYQLDVPTDRRPINYEETSAQHDADARAD